MAHTTVRTPSTVGNFGPGFDATSLAIAWGGDTVRVTVADEDHITLEGAGAEQVPTAWADNCCSAAFTFLRDRHGVSDKHNLHITKGVHPGSGLGSSASSSAAGALAFAKLYPEVTVWTPEAVVEAATYGEARVAGAHGDDVAAAIMGGLSIVAKGRVGRVQPPASLHLAICVPRFSLETRLMREAVGKTVAVPDAVSNLANVAFLVDAMHRGDIDMIAHSLTDRIAAPGRKQHLPFHDDVVKAATDAGAIGCAISGSGPAMFTVTDDAKQAKVFAEAMADAVAEHGREAFPLACKAERTRVFDQILR
ncbi:MAG: homoserine kinase [Euryarchaeota archaeon]|nr:homoserine kinase [Euryarchaeota archaeon]